MSLRFFSTFLPSFLLLVSTVYCHEGHDHNHDHGAMTTTVKPSTASLFNWTHQSTDLKKLVGVEFRWKADDPQWIIMEMSTKTRGYVSLGFCPEWHGSMKDCDIVIGGVNDETGEGYLTDYYATDNIEPVKDDSQDYELVAAEQAEWLTKITFKRKWNTGDPHDANLEKSKVQLIWSWNPEDVKGSVILPHDRNTRGHTKTMISLKSPPPGNVLRVETSTANPTTTLSYFSLLIFTSLSFLISRQ